jgi:hypothetical protein
MGHYLLIAGPGLGIQGAVKVETGLVCSRGFISTVHIRYKTIEKIQMRRKNKFW